MKKPATSKSAASQLSENILPGKDELSILAAIIHSSTDAIFSKDLEGIIATWNPAAEQLFGYTAAEIIGKNISLIIPPEYANEEKEITSKISKGGAVSQFETKRKRKNGELVLASISHSPIKNAKGKVIGISVIARSIPGTHPWENLKQSLIDLHAIVENAEVGFVLTDRNGIIRAFNSKAKESIIFNRKQQVKTGDNLFEYVDEERKGYFRDIISQVLNGKAIRYDRSYERKDGSIIWYNFSLSPVREKEEITGICITGTDITKRKLAEKKAEENEKRFRAIVENSGDAVTILAPNGKPLYISPSIKNILGYTEDEAMNLDFFSLIHPDDLSEVSKSWEQVMANPGIPVQGQICRVMHKDGTWRWLDGTITNMLHEPAIGGIVDNFRDITEKIHAEKEMTELQKKMDIAIRLMKLGHWEWDIAEDKITGSDRFYEIYGIEKGRVINAASMINHIHPGDRTYLTEIMPRLMEEKKGDSIEYRILHPDGSVRYVQSNREALTNEKDETVKFIGSLLDITRQKLAEKVIVDNETRFKRLVENSGDGVVILKPDSKPTYVSPSITKLLGYTEEEAMHLDLFSLIHPDELAQVKVIWEKILVTPGVPHSGNVCRVLHKNGSWRWFEGTITNMLHEPAINGIVDNFRDITEKKEADKKLRLSEERYRHLFYDNPLPMWIYDPVSLKFLEVNDAAIKKYEYNREEFLQLTIRDIRPASEVPKLMAIMTDEKLFNSGAIWKHFTKSRDLLEVEITRHKVVFENREAMLVVVNDVTEKKKAARLLLKAYQDNTNILESITDGFFTLDKNWTVTYWNKKAEEILQKKRQDILGKNIWEEYEFAVALKFYSESQKAMKEQVPLSFEEFFPPLAVWLEVSAYPSEDVLSVYFKDITERKTADEKIRTAKERYEMVARATNDAIYEWDIINNVNYWGEGFETLFGHKRSDDNMPVESWIDNLHPDERENLLAIANDAFEKKINSISRELRFRCADGSFKTVFDKLAILYDTDSRPVKIIGAMQDITELKKNELAIKELNQQLNKRAEELASSNEELERFAYVASHDLQEPLRMVSSFLQLLQRKYQGQLDATAGQYIGFAVDGAERMKRLILDLLEYSRAGTNKDVQTDIDMGELVTQVLKDFDMEITQRDAVIKMELLPVIKANKTQIIQLIQNLVGNALKYNTSFVPEIAIGCRDTDNGWEFFVKDNGIGIERRFFERVFTIFQRLHNKKQFSGTGIGLAICKKIVEKHGGNIWVESEPGKGSTFFFTIKK